MGVALFIVAERDVEGLDTFVNGKALAHCRPHASKSRLGRQASEHLEWLANQAGVKPLMDFFSADPADVLEMMEESEVESPESLDPEQWFPASEGLATVRGLIAYLSSHPEAAAEVDALLNDLGQYEEVLKALEAADVRWHLAVDF